MTPPKEMVDVLQRLRNGNPEAFDAFVQMFAAYYGGVLNELVMAPQSDVLKCQGRAQQVQSFIGALKQVQT